MGPSMAIRTSQPCPGEVSCRPSLGTALSGGQLPEPPLPSPPLPAAASAGSQRPPLPGLGARAVTCLTNNILRIDCHWPAPEPGPGPSPWLLFTSNHAPGSRHRCVFRGSACTVVLPPEEVIAPSDNFTITLHRRVAGEEQVSLVDPQYLPRRHVKLDPPSDLQSNVSSDSCVLTWGVSPALEPLASLLSYELAFKRQEEAWERARHRDHIVGVTGLTLEAVELDPGSTYEARLRVQMASLEDALAEEERYEGPWSEWSQPVSFPSPRRQGRLVSPLRQPDSTLVAMSIFLLLTSVAYLLFKLSPRVKRTLHQDVPSPVPFFQPLYSVHHGNFQVRGGGGEVAQGPGRLRISPWRQIPGCLPAAWSFLHLPVSVLAAVGRVSVCELPLGPSLAPGPLSGGHPPALFQTWTGTHRAGTQPSPGGVSAHGAPGSGAREAIAVLVFEPAEPWPPAGLEQEGPGPGLPADVLPAAPEECAEQPPAYLPQEEWGPVSPARPAPPEPEGGSSGYCALGCYGWCHPPPFPGHAQGAGPCGLPCDQQSLAPGPGGQGPDLGDQAE
ncbi:interleukin-9 receptor [Pipistrellus kuhlii]|uniref:interleukin-9 receptor n=1 Tax=Pipistrellus kuhlii TaxID=59472 RepID=UPI001E27469C|nr:interleukin-9 receptor [Pipistrellus kuhlii]